jgi:hypothetical protein
VLMVLDRHGAAERTNYLLLPMECVKQDLSVNHRAMGFILPARDTIDANKTRERHPTVTSEIYVLSNKHDRSCSQGARLTGAMKPCPRRSAPSAAIEILN